ncbi:RIP metalloprotease RseP [Staphylococcus agnetis]|uniref:RIP metalloprotease RseP n=1 Tax=Staphylococcus agnetis TaxID=985762 RepID=UPI0004E32C9B|nr:RIP metalloprotease RseP [Staphylococcus agnetis]KFE42862.1 membrane-associated zinc metalloprotease [Staphylococcus agnetis]NJH66338.1 RIP metalloprotease RseP [Staphylococcus agnetis]PTH47331.1 RIP metalloprotease RseP [Staphylococcus agnetis]PTH74024.1 RIP metalloprotease RseP [Staphylococcus agnetis]PTH75924.1 RIP metalloprotease RseP [Staphylococcus agnetis]
MFITIIAFICVFGLLVSVHEYGHMLFAKRAGIMCPEFAIGMGPKILSFRKNETLYTIRLLPVGGYVRMAGDGMEEAPVQPGMHVKIKLNDQNEITHIILDDQHKFQQMEAIEVKKADFNQDLYIEGIMAHDQTRHHYPIAKKAFFVQNGSLIQIAPRERQFAYKKPYQKFLTLFAGPLFNFILAAVLLIGLAYWQGAPTNKVDQVAPKTPAAQIGLKKGDVITEINGHATHNLRDIQKEMKATNGDKTTLKFERDGKVHTETFSPKKFLQNVSKTKSVTKHQLGFLPTKEVSPIEPLIFGLTQTVEYGKIVFTAVVGLIGSIFTGHFSFDMLNGPVGIYKNVDTVVKTGIINLINFTAILSVNLGIMNLLPIPALDGGRILFVAYEAIFRKPANKKAETVIIAAGAIFVVIIMILVTWNDIQRYFL